MGIVVSSVGVVVSEEVLYSVVYPEVAVLVVVGVMDLAAVEVGVVGVVSSEVAGAIVPVVCAVEVSNSCVVSIGSVAVVFDGVDVVVVAFDVTPSRVVETICWVVAVKS